MYRHILVSIEHSAADQTILDHVKPLAKLTGARLPLLHVADGWVARNYRGLNLAESEEMKRRSRLPRKTRHRTTWRGFSVDYLLALGGAIG